MKAEVVAIGNSRGIRIPKIVLEQCHIKKNVTLDIVNDMIIIKPDPEKRRSRKGWELAFKQMHKNKEDHLLISDRVDLDMAHWEW